VLDERCDQVAEERSAVGRVSAQVSVFCETSGHGGCSLRRCLLSGILDVPVRCGCEEEKVYNPRVSQYKIGGWSDRESRL